MNTPGNNAVFGLLLYMISPAIIFSAGTTYKDGLDFISVMHDRVLLDPPSQKKDKFLRPNCC